MQMAASAPNDTKALPLPVQEGDIDNAQILESPDGAFPNTVSSALNSFGNRFRLKCAFCLGDIKRPKQLDSCFHIFCAECLRQRINILNLVGGMELKCPACEKSSRIPRDISAWLDGDQYFQATSEFVCTFAESGSLICNDASHQGDSAVQAEHFCYECGRNFCEACNNNHSDLEVFRSHHVLRLFKNSGIETIRMRGRERRPLDSPLGKIDQELGNDFKCPICRNADMCEHEVELHRLQDLVQSAVHNFETSSKHRYCDIPSHGSETNPDENKFRGWCQNCNQLLCRNCSYFDHRNHKIQNIEDAVVESLPSFEKMIKSLKSCLEMFQGSLDSVEKIERTFPLHIHSVQKEMQERKGMIHTDVEKAFESAYRFVEKTGQKQKELNRQGLEVRQETNFLKKIMEIVDLYNNENISDVEKMQIWKSTQFFMQSLIGTNDEGGKKKEVLPQKIVEKCLVLPAPNCVSPDLSILMKVGVEGARMERCLKINFRSIPLCLTYSILPLTEVEILTSCETEAHRNAVIQFSNKDPIWLDLDGEGEYHIVAVPGNGIVLTYNCAQKNENKVYFWDHALDCKITKHEAEGIKLKEIGNTDLPPRGLAVTRESNLVICTAVRIDHKSGEDMEVTDKQGSGCRIVLMTLQGDILNQVDPYAGRHRNGSNDYIRHVTVNINGDICTTDRKTVMIFSRSLKYRMTIRNPYPVHEHFQDFVPEGICHDSFGRLIVADSANNTVLRFQLSNLNTYEMEIILQPKISASEDFFSPSLVAIGPLLRLWVVCKNFIFVYNYMDEE